MNCRLGDLRSLGKHTLVPRALERHAMPDRLMMEDAALAEEARNGNSAAFVKLANRWWTPLYRVSWIVSGSALVERKDRSYDAGLRDSPEKRVRRVQDEVRNSKIQTDPARAGFFLSASSTWSPPRRRRLGTAATDVA